MWLFVFLKRNLTIVQIKSQVSLQQQTKQPPSGNIQDLKVLGTFVSGCVLFFVVNSKNRPLKSVSKRLLFESRVTESM